MSPSEERLIGPRDVKASKPALLADPIYHDVLEYDPQTVSSGISKIVVLFFSSFFPFFSEGRRVP